MTFPLMDRTRRLTEEALGEAGLSWNGARPACCSSAARRGCRWSGRTSRRWPGQPPRAGVNVDEVVALGAAIQAAMEVGPDGRRRGARSSRSPGARRVRDVMSHSLGTVAVSPDGSAYVNDVVIRRNLPIPAENTKSYLHATHGGANERLEVYLTQGESTRPLDCTVLGKYVFSGIQATDAEVTVDVGMSYDANGVVQVRGHPARHRARARR